MRYCIEVNPQSSEMVQKYLFSKGYKWGGFDIGTTLFNTAPYMFINTRSKVLTWGTKLGVGDDKVVGFNELCQLVDEKITVGEYVVELTDDGIKVGCQLVCFSKIREINRWLKDQNVEIV